jgi:hypothetical protein
MALVSVVDSFQLEATAAGALAGGVLAASGFRILGSVLFRLQQIYGELQRVHLRPLLGKRCYSHDARTDRDVCCFYNAADRLRHDHAWLTEHDLLVDPSPFYLANGAAPVLRTSATPCKIDSPRNRGVSVVSTTSPTMQREGVANTVSAPLTPSGDVLPVVDGASLTERRDPRPGTVSRHEPDRENTRQVVSRRQSGAHIAGLPTPPPICTAPATAQVGLELPAMRPIDNGMFMFRTAPGYTSDNGYDSDASTISDLDEEELVTPTATTSNSVQTASACPEDTIIMANSSPDHATISLSSTTAECGAPCIKQTASFNDPLPPNPLPAAVEAPAQGFLAVHGRQPGQWLPANKAAPLIRNPWTGKRGPHKAREAVGKGQQMFLRDFSHASFSRSRKAQRDTIFEETTLGRIGEAPQAHRSMLMRSTGDAGAKKVVPASNFRQVVAIPSPSKGAQCTPTALPYSQSTVAAVATTESPAAHGPLPTSTGAPSVRGRRVSCFPLPPIVEGIPATPLANREHRGRRQSFVVMSNGSNSPLRGTALSFMRAIDPRYGDEGSLGTTWHDASQSEMASPSVHSSPHQAAESARRTLLKFSAADFSDRVTRAAYKKAHGRRMSTLRHMQRRMSSSAVPFEPPNEQEDRAAKKAAS